MQRLARMVWGTFFPCCPGVYGLARMVFSTFAHLTAISFISIYLGNAHTEPTHFKRGFPKTGSNELIDQLLAEKKALILAGDEYELKYTTCK